AEDPVSKLLALGDNIANPAIPAPLDIFGARQNSLGLDVADPISFGEMETSRAQYRTHHWQASPLVAAPVTGSATRSVANPADLSDRVGEVLEAAPADVAAAVNAATASPWHNIPPAQRADMLRK